MVLKGQSSHPASANFHLIFKLWAETVEKMSGGRLKIETLPAGAIVPAFEVFDATSKGVLDVGMAPFGYIQGRNTATIPMSHGPLFGMDGQDYFGWYYDGGGMALLEEFYRDVIKLNVVGFPIPTDYPQGLGWFKKEIKSLADLKGMKYRIYGIGAETYGKLGVSVVTIPGGEIVPALGARRHRGRRMDQLPRGQEARPAQDRQALLHAGHARAGDRRAADVQQGRSGRSSRRTCRRW